MTPTNRETAEAFSSHRFDEVLPLLVEDIEWVLVGDATITGPQAVSDACRSTLDELAGAQTRFTRFDVVDGGEVVVVDSTGVYVDSTGDTTSVSSCDIYRFRDNRIIAIRSYTVEVPSESEIPAMGA